MKMIRLYDMEPGHLLRIEPQDGQADVELNSYYARLCVHSGDSISLIDYETSRVLMCAGAAKIWDGRFMIWSVISRHAGPHMLAISRAARRMLDTLSGRLEAYVDPKFAAGHRWARMMGFKHTELARRFLPNGGDASIYVRYN